MLFCIFLSLSLQLAKSLGSDTPKLKSKVSHLLIKPGPVLIFLSLHLFISRNAENSNSYLAWED